MSVVLALPAGAVNAYVSIDLSMGDALRLEEYCVHFTRSRGLVSGATVSWLRTWPEGRLAWPLSPLYVAQPVRRVAPRAAKRTVLRLNESFFIVPPYRTEGFVFNRRVP